MIVKNILNEVQSEIPKLIETKQVYRAINRVIRDINSKYPGIVTTELTLTIGGAFNDGFSNGFVTDTLAEDNYSWDNDNLILTLSPYTREILDVYCDGTYNYELTRENVNTVKNYNNSVSTYAGDKYIYARYDRNKVIFPTGLLSEGDTIKIKYLKDIIPLVKLDSVTSDTEIDMPQSLEQALVNGVFFYLYSLPQYKDTDLYKINERAYFAGLTEAKESEIRNMQSETKQKDYTY